MLKKILAGLFGVIAAFMIAASMRPSHFSVTRTAQIAASQEVVFSNVNNLHTWQEWSPWAKLDPNAKAVFEGPPAGTGASFDWAGNSEVGEGKMTITESRPNEFIQFRLDFRKPFAGTNTAQFIFKPIANDTEVSWTMSGENNFVAKMIGLIIDCDKMVGDYFEKGLSNLKALSENPQVG